MTKIPTKKAAKKASVVMDDPCRPLSPERRDAFNSMIRRGESRATPPNAVDPTVVPITPEP